MHRNWKNNRIRYPSPTEDKPRLERYQNYQVAVSNWSNVRTQMHPYLELAMSLFLNEPEAKLWQTSNTYHLIQLERHCIFWPSPVQFIHLQNGLRWRANQNIFSEGVCVMVIIFEIDITATRHRSRFEDWKFWSERSKKRLSLDSLSRAYSILYLASACFPSVVNFVRYGCEPVETPSKLI